MTETPWTRSEIRINLLALIVLLIFTSIALILKSWLYFIFYAIIWILYIVVGRYYVCRHCQFYGQPCPSWCMGIIGAKLYKRTDKKSFIENGLSKAFLGDILFFIIAVLFPFVIYGLEFVLNGLTIIDWVLLIITASLTIIMLALHSKGCNKCPIDGCPMNKTKKK